MCVQSSTPYLVRTDTLYSCAIFVSQVIKSEKEAEIHRKLLLTCHLGIGMLWVEEYKACSSGVGDKSALGRL